MNFSQSFIKLEPGESPQSRIKKAAGLAPAPRQLAWQSLEMTAFIHYGIATYYDREWGNGTEAPADFFPTNFDAGQWVEALSGAGFKGLILTCKHHDGYCLWPSAYTEHSVKNSPWRDGKGDVVREVSDACRKVGMKFGVYLSPWDRHDYRYGDSPAYNAYFLAQLEELLTQYGEIYEVWFDGACAEGPNGKVQAYDWAAYYSLIRRLQPQAVITVEGPDVRWVGNEAGRGRESEWSVFPYGKVLSRGEDTPEAFIVRAVHCTHPDLGSDKVLTELDSQYEYLFWYPAQVNTSIRPGWFYHTWEDEKVKPLHQLVKIYHASVGGNAQLLLNIPPDTRGMIHEKDVLRLKELSQYLKTAYSDNLAENGSVKTYREADAFITELRFERKIVFNQLVLAEDITRGQHVAVFSVWALLDGGMRQIAEGTTVGYKKILPVPETATSVIQIKTTGYRDTPYYNFFGVYRVPVIKQPPSIHRNQAGLVTITAGESAQIFWSCDDNEDWTPYTKPFPFEQSGRLKALAQYNSDNVYGTEEPVADAFFGMLKDDWKVRSHTGACAEKFPVEHFVNDDWPRVVLHGKLPLEIEVDMGKTVIVGGFTYLPVDNIFDFAANLHSYALLVSEDGKNYISANEGTLDNIRNNPVLQIVRFSKSFKARYFKFVAKTGFETERVALGKLSLL